MENHITNNIQISSEAGLNLWTKEVICLLHGNGQHI